MAPTALPEPFIATDYLFLVRNQKHDSVYASDPEIVSAIRKGDESAFEQTFRDYYPRLCNYAHSLLKDAEESEEVVQSLFLNIWEKREELEITLSLKAYLYRAVHNRCLNRFKHASVRAEHRAHALYVGQEAYESVAETIHAAELEERITKAVDILPEPCRTTFRLSRFEDLKYQEIADRLGIPVKTVENQIGKALKLLRAELADYLPSALWPVFFVIELLTSLFK